MSNNWSFAGVWNTALDIDRQRELEPRDYIWASELGRGYYDRYWKMKGRKPTTPPGVRAQRKFEAGNLTEWVMLQILARAGILQETQTKVEDTTGPIRVSGRCDFMAGGQIKDVENIDLVGLPENFQAMAKMAIENLKEKYPDGLKDVGIEIKSCSGLMFDKYKAAPATNHGLQSFFYAKTLNRPFLLVYVSRDDLRVCEYVILPDSERWSELYETDIAAMSELLEASDVLPMQPLLTWENERFGKNWEIEYSSYLTDYGFDRPDQYAEKASSTLRRLNNIVKKIKEGKPIDGTVNQKTLKECYAFYPEAENIIKELEEKYGRTDN